MTAAEARAKTLAEIEASAIDRATGPWMEDFAEEFMGRPGATATPCETRARGT